MPEAILQDGLHVAELPRTHCVTTDEALAPPELASLQALIEAGEPALDYVRKIPERIETSGQEDGVDELGSVCLQAPLPPPYLESSR